MMTRLYRLAHAMARTGVEGSQQTVRMFFINKRYIASRLVARFPIFGEIKAYATNVWCHLR